ncbi:MAG: ethanolamine utilization protein [Chloroflexota bacterium]|nr:MAG: ethanolamine utilization protein [Chloroflexota bacterium]
MTHSPHSMLSVGIDVGTTTTQLIFSRLILGGGAASSSQSPLSRMRSAGIVDKEVLYRSQIHFTPLKGPDEIDAPALEQILRQEYRQAGILPDQVETGAVIVTGETAKKRNADAILEAISALAGDFVVTVAGPHLESMISGRGAGAASYSREHYCTVTNVDIGGGSANSAIFRQGEMIASAAMNYGGRILQLDPASGHIRHIADPARLIIEYLGLPFQLGSQPALAHLRTFTHCMADLTVSLIEGTSHPLGDKLMLTAHSPVSGQGTILFFSGGIGHYFYEPLTINSVADATIHGDVGPLLAESLRLHPKIQGYTIRRPPETMGATVMGASSQTITLSGSTIWAEAEILPIRNVPVVRAHWPAVPPTRQQVTQTVQEAITRWDVNPAESQFALALELTWKLDFNQLSELAAGLADFALAKLPAHQPFIIIIEHDYARALGQSVKTLIPQHPLLVVDQVGLQEGDYIDIGRPLLDGRVVPLSVKTLIFYH